MILTLYISVLVIYKYNVNILELFGSGGLYVSDDYVISKIFEDYVELDRDLPDTSNCYVYGTEVDDFHRLKKDRIFSLNVSATQELYKIIQQQQQTIESLTQRIEHLENI